MIEWSAESVSISEACVLTIGVFDGLHLGHQALIREVVNRASLLRLPAACITFFPSPEAVLGQAEVKYLLLPDERTRLMFDMGVQLVIVTKFDARLAGMSAAGFMALVRDALHPVEVWVGEDFALGRNREGNADFLNRLGRDMGYQLRVVPRHKIADKAVSSSWVRALIGRGDVGEASQLLGRPYAITGRVVKGFGRGRALGFPTANLILPSDKQLPADGVYAAVVDTGTGRWPAAVSIGVRPTFAAGERAVEAHLLGFDGDLYGSQLTVEFITRLRGERRFASVAELREQIRADVAIIAAIFAEAVDGGASQHGI